MSKSATAILHRDRVDFVLGTLCLARVVKRERLSRWPPRALALQRQQGESQMHRYRKENAMRNPLFVHFILVIGLVSSGTVSARPFQPSDVTAEAQWILHVDLEAMKPAETGEKRYQDRVAKHPFVRSLKAGRWKVNVDFRGEPRGVTLYGPTLSQLQGVLFLYTEPGDSRPVAVMPELPGSEIISYHSHRLHAWTWCEEKEPSLALALPRDDLVIWASSIELIKSALDVLDGRSAGLDEQDAVLGTDVPEGTMFLVGARGLDSMDFSDRAPLLETLTGFQYAEGVDDGQWFSLWTALTVSADANRHLKSMVDGIVSAFWLFYGEKQEEQDKETRMEVSTHARKIQVRLNAPADELATRFKSLWTWMYAAETDTDDSKRKRTQATSAAGKKSAAKDDGAQTGGQTGGKNGGQNGGQEEGGT